MNKNLLIQRPSGLLSGISVALVALAGLAFSQPGSAQKGGPNQQPPPDPAIAYVSAASGGELRVMNADGTNNTIILRKGGAVFPNWSPDGSKIVFESGPYGVQGHGIYIVNKDGSGLCKVAALNATSVGFGGGPVWSPVALADGKYRIAYSDRPTPTATYGLDVYVVNADCSNPGAPAQLTFGPGEIGYPSWSRLANHLAVFRSGEIFDLSVAMNNGAVVVTSEIKVTEFAPFVDTMAGYADYCRTDERLAVIGWVPPDGYNTDVWVIDDVNPAYSYNLTNTSVREMYPSWSPDSTEIVYGRTVETNNTHWEIWKVNLLTGAQTRIAGGSPQSPDGAHPDWRRCIRAGAPCPQGSVCQICQ